MAKHHIEYSKLKLSTKGRVQGDHDLVYDRPKSNLNLPKNRSKLNLKNRKSGSVIEQPKDDNASLSWERRNMSARNWMSISHNNSVISLTSNNDNAGELSSRDNSISTKSKSKRRVFGSASQSKLSKWMIFCWTFKPQSSQVVSVQNVWS